MTPLANYIAGLKQNEHFYCDHKSSQYIVMEADRNGIKVSTTRGWFVSNWSQEPIQILKVTRVK